MERLELTGQHALAEPTIAGAQLRATVSAQFRSETETGDQRFHE